MTFFTTTRKCQKPYPKPFKTRGHCQVTDLRMALRQRAGNISCQPPDSLNLMAVFRTGGLVHLHRVILYNFAHHFCGCGFGLGRIGFYPPKLDGCGVVIYLTGVIIDYLSEQIKSCIPMGFHYCFSPIVIIRGFRVYAVHITTEPNKTPLGRNLGGLGFFT